MTLARIGPIEVLETLGQGAKSTVMLVRRDDDGLEYALKVVPVAKLKERKYLAQARQEYRVGQLLDHPSLVKIHLLETENDWFFRAKRVKLLIEYVPGQTLDKTSSPTVGTLLRAFERVADGVAYMHENGIVHADLKPNNIMVGPDVVKVIDFGLARIDGESTGRLQGTPEYMAPETAARKIVNELTDIFNFGSTMYRLVTGHHTPNCSGFPMTERAFHERLLPARQLSPAIPAGFGGLIDRTLRFKPSDRPQSMDEVCQVLNRLVDEHGEE